MRSSILSAFALFAISAIALPTSGRHAVHEKRSSASTWSPKKDVKPDGRIKLPIRIGLAENNLDLGEEMLMKVSHPMSSGYGKHWTLEEVLNALLRLWHD